MSQILLVEDQPNQRALYHEELADEGYHVLAAGTGEEALDLFTRHHPQLVIVDVLLPGMDGLEVMEKMLSVDPNLAILVHSAYSSPSRDPITGYALAYVVKSGDLTELKEQVRCALAKVAAPVSEVPAPWGGAETDPRGIPDSGDALVFPDENSCVALQTQEA